MILNKINEWRIYIYICSTFAYRVWGCMRDRLHICYLTYVVLSLSIHTIFNNNFKVIPWDGTTWNVVQDQIMFIQQYVCGFNIICDLSRSAFGKSQFVYLWFKLNGFGGGDELDGWICIPTWISSCTIAKWIAAITPRATTHWHMVSYLNIGYN